MGRIITRGDPRWVKEDDPVWHEYQNAKHDFRVQSAVDRKHRRHMEGQFYNDLLEPDILADVGSVTLSTTYKAMWPAANVPVQAMGTFFNKRVGRKLKIYAFGRMTTVLTPGNIQVGILYGTGADANGVTVQQSAAVALAVSQTNLSWWVELHVHTRSLGATGTLFGTGIFHCNVALILSTAQPLLIPASAPAVSGACDLTNSALYVGLQILRSGSTAETAQVHDLEYIAMN